MEKGISYNLEVVFSFALLLQSFANLTGGSITRITRNNGPFIVVSDLPRPKTPDGTKCGMCPIKPNMNISLIEVGKSNHGLNNFLDKQQI
jgi:hypothetical protein